MPAQASTHYHVNCGDCFLALEFDTEREARDGARAHNAEKHPQIVVADQGVTLEFNAKTLVWTIKVPQDAAQRLDYDLLAYLGSIMQNGRSE